MRQELLGPVDHTPEIDVHDPLVTVVVEIGDRTVVGNAGVVVDLVDLAEVRGHLAGVAGECFPVTDVKGGSVRIGAAADHRGGLLRGFEIHVTDRDSLRSPPRQFKGQGPADAGPRAGYSTNFSTYNAQTATSSFVWDFRSLRRNSMYSSATSPSLRKRASFA